MDSKEAHHYVEKLHGRISREPGWAFDPWDERPDWYRRALSAVALLSEGEEPVYISGKYDEDNRAGMLHLFYTRSVITIEARRDLSDLENATVTERPRAGLGSLKLHVSEPPSDDLFRRDFLPGKVFVWIHYPDGPVIQLPVSATNDSRMSDELVELLPSLRADLGVRVGADLA